MPIREEDRCFGEGLSSYGEEDPHRAFEKHKAHLRSKRLEDLLGKDTKLDCDDLSNKFENIALAINAADKQSNDDNAAFLKKHSIQPLKLTSWT